MHSIQRFCVAVPFSLLVGVSGVRAESPIPWETLPAADVQRLVAHPDGKRWFLPAPKAVAVVPQAGRKRYDDCACTTAYWMQFTLRRTFCSVPEQFSELVEQEARMAGALRLGNLAAVENVRFSKVKFGAGGALPPELNCVTHYGPWPAVLSSTGTCASTYSYTLQPLDPAIAPLSWTGDIYTPPPGDISLVQQPVWIGEHCVPCGGGTCSLEPNPGDPPPPIY